MSNREAPRDRFRSPDERFARALSVAFGNLARSAAIGAALEAPERAQPLAYVARRLRRHERALAERAAERVVEHRSAEPAAFRPCEHSAARDGCTKVASHVACARPSAGRRKAAH
jgi:hypothetical protein